MGYLVEGPLVKAYKSRYVHMPESALFQPVNEQIAVAKELGISMLVMVKVGFAFSKIMYYDVKNGNQMTAIHVWAIDNPLVVATARQCEEKLAHNIQM